MQMVPRAGGTLSCMVRPKSCGLMVCSVSVSLISKCKCGPAGASAGPHLHFEIRDTETEQTINPQLFGLTIHDKVPPALGTICIYHLGDAPFSEKTPRQFMAV